MKFINARRVAMLTAAFAVAAHPLISTAQETGMYLGASYVLNGDFVAGSVNTRTANPLAPGQADPAPLAIAGIPGGAVIVDAWLNWNYLTPAPGAGTEMAVTLNGFAVGGFLAGSGSPDLCWGFASGASYVANVTGIVAAFGNGVYALGSAGDDVGGTGAFAEGASLVVVYSSVGDPLRAVHVYGGYTSNTSGGGVGALPFIAPYMGGPAHFFQNSLDGQPAGDIYTLNGVDVSGVFPGTGVAGDASLGLVGGAPTGGLYDHFEGDASPYMTLGDVGILAGTPGLISDCIGHTFGAMSFTTVPEPSSMLALTGLALLAIRRRKR